MGGKNSKNEDLPPPEQDEKEEELPTKLVSTNAKLTTEQVSQTLKEKTKDELEGYTRINLDKNELENIPEEMLQCLNISSLSLSSNKLSSDAFTTLCSFTALKELKLNGNKIRQLPEQLSQLNNLTLLQLGENNIERIPKSLCTLSKLETLYLHKNSIAKLPSQMRKLEKLKELYLGQNLLPDSLMKLKSKSTQKRLKDIQMHFEPIEIMDNIRDCALVLIWIRKNHKEECGLLGQVPVELVKEMAMDTWSTRWEKCWFEDELLQKLDVTKENIPKPPPPPVDNKEKRKSVKKDADQSASETDETSSAAE